MDIDTIKKLIQEFFQEGTVTIVGSGLSLAEGIPGMWELAKELQVKVPGMLSTSADVANWEAISNDLTSGVGLEQALHNTKPNSTVEECIRKITAIYIGEAEKGLLEDIVRKGKQLRFSEYLQRFNIRNQGMAVITTNYDRSIEYACEVNDIIADTLFVGKYMSRFKPDESKYASCIGVHRKPGKRQKLLHSPMVTVLKPHGCLSWHLINGIPYSIPIPLWCKGNFALKVFLRFRKRNRKVFKCIEHFWMPDDKMNRRCLSFGNHDPLTIMNLNLNIPKNLCLSNI